MTPAPQDSGPIARLQRRFGRVFKQRCFYLFFAMLALIVAVPFVAELERGRIVMHVLHVLVLVAAVAAVGRTTLPFAIALLLGIPALVVHLAGGGGEARPGDVPTLAAWFYLAFYVVP